ncbi:hypothetical protein TRIP_B300035 [uncultured Desulfatiglans sp.]|uniref:HPr kinase n=1 Tax=Uncultured Desulfatiglans sp. TaxID=1748965 RepID=A0A653A6G2_UNCDX|nr:hypothetical protein TRIP_B300035 [uncultured Desulfatiglans sp.]
MHLNITFMFIENYSIHHKIAFQLLNNTRYHLIENINSEYEYFRTDKNITLNFKLVVTKEFNIQSKDQTATHQLQKQYDGWRVHLIEHKNGFIECQIIPYFDGVRKPFSYTAIKNLYVRSLISYSLLKKGRSLVHSCSFSLDGKACLLAGRPGVFKTSILMDVIRRHGAQFLGEENTMLSDGLLYPFPLNLKSFRYKINHFRDENAGSSFDKIKLGLQLLRKGKTAQDNSITISKPKKPVIVCYLTKGDKFGIAECRLEDVIPELVENEMKELSIPPTHSLSGIKYNYFAELLQECNPAIISKMRQDLFVVFAKDFGQSACYRISTPKTYDVSISDSILSKVMLFS